MRVVSSDHADRPISLYLRLIDFVYHSTLGLRILKKQERDGQVFLLVLVSGLGLRAQDLRLGVGIRVEGRGFGVSGLGFSLRVYG